MVVLASWAPSGSPSATTSNLRVSGLSEVKVANHDISRHPATCFATDASSHRLQSVRPSASCTVVATSVEWKPPAGTHGQGKREMEAAQWDLEELRVDSRDATRGTSGQRKASSRSALRSHESLT